jgi:acyl-CoA thioester hydrolase
MRTSMLIGVKFDRKEARMSEFTITHRGTVYPWQCDHMGHMNVMWYVAKFDEACWQLLSSLALTRQRFARDGVGMAAVEQRIEYKRELHAGDVVTIRSTVLEVKDKAIRMRHEMTNDVTGDLAAVTEIVGVHIETANRRACALPADVRERANLVAKGDGGRGEHRTMAAAATGDDGPALAVGTPHEHSGQY